MNANDSGRARWVANEPGLTRMNANDWESVNHALSVTSVEGLNELVRAGVEHYMRNGGSSSYELEYLIGERVAQRLDVPASDFERAMIGRALREELAKRK